MALGVAASLCAWRSGFLRFSVVLIQGAIQRAEEVGDGEAEGVGEFLDVVDGDVRFALFAGQGWPNAAGAGCAGAVRSG